MNYQNELNRKIYSADARTNKPQKISNVLAEQLCFRGLFVSFHVRETNREANTGRRCRQFLQLASSPRCFHPRSTSPRSFSIALSPKLLPASNSRENSRSSACSRTKHYYQIALAQCFHPFTVRSYAKTSGRLLHIQPSDFFRPLQLTSVN